MAGNSAQGLLMPSLSYIWAPILSLFLSLSLSYLPHPSSTPPPLPAPSLAFVHRHPRLTTPYTAPVRSPIPALALRPPASTAPPPRPCRTPCSRRSPRQSTRLRRALASPTPTTTLATPRRAGVVTVIVPPATADLSHARRATHARRASLTAQSTGHPTGPPPRFWPASRSRPSEPPVPRVPRLGPAPHRASPACLRAPRLLLPRAVPVAAPRPDRVRRRPPRVRHAPG
ncbi:CASP-like protein 4U1 [Miscanthus floridulus]|uniref:CASP-like protein 4U1 n=1 Tax=Miscanthus floridulus TaxID=154761 RepID=UPI0034578B69